MTTSLFRIPQITSNVAVLAAFVIALFTPYARAQDVDGDGVPDDQDVCDNTPAGIAVDSSGRPRGDLDLDCDTDMDDFSLFQNGFTGPLAAHELCADGLDNDGDGLIDCEDPADCPAGTLCAGGLHCSQFATCGCPDGYADCNGVLEDGCETSLNTNPACTAGQHDLLSVRGDEGSDVRTFAGSGERWFRIRITENSNFDTYLSARIELESGSQANYDLYVRCGSCSGNLAGTSANPTGLDLVTVANDDDFGSDDSFDVLIEVRYLSGGCEEYTLRVIGNTSASLLTCD